MNLITYSKNFIKDNSGSLPAVGLLAASVTTEVATTNPRFTLITGATSTAVGFYGLVDTTKKLWNKTQNENESLLDNTKLLAKGSLYLMAFGFGLYQLASYEQSRTELDIKAQSLQANISALNANTIELEQAIKVKDSLIEEKKGLLKDANNKNFHHKLNKEFLAEMFKLFKNREKVISKLPSVLSQCSFDVAPDEYFVCYDTIVENPEEVISSS